MVEKKHSKYRRYWLLLAFFCCSTSVLYAQIPPLNQDTREYGNQLGLQNQLDSLGNDSAMEEIEIKPDVRLVNPENMYRHREYIIPLVSDFTNTHYWDELDQVQGFVYSLGQIGKPYEAFRYGIGERFDPDLPYWRNPIFERYNVYVFNNIGQIPYYDTKTPYVNAKYAQASRQMQRVDVTVSRNIVERWNMSFLYQGRQSQGAYLQFNTNHISLFASTYYYTQNEKYHLYSNWSYNEMNDDLFGGVVRNTSSFASGDVSESLEDDSNSLSDFFDKDEENLVSGDGNRKKIVRQFTVDQYYHLIKGPDSLPGPHKLTLRGLLRGEWANHNFEDNQLNISKLETHAIPVYPTRDTSTAIIQEIFKSRQFNALGGFSYTLDTELNIHTEGYVSYSSIQLDQDTLQSLTLNRFEIFGKAKLGLKWGEASFSIHQRATNLYNPQNRINSEITFFPLSYKYKDGRAALEAEKDVAEDSANIYRMNSPLILTMQYRRWGQNPSLFQSHYQPSSGNVYQPNPDLNNQQFNRLVGRAQWQEQALIRRGDTLLPSYYFAEVFATRVSRMIYYDREMNVRQAAEGTPLSWFGLRVGGRTRILDKFYIESELTWQRGTTDATDDFRYYAENLPQLWGKTSFYYDNRDLSFAAILRFGVEVYYFTHYMGFTIDMTSQEFFPTNYLVSGYPRADAFFATKVKGADIFFKFSHWNEGLLRQGYYTTPFYPMLESTFSFGINWSFYN